MFSSLFKNKSKKNGPLKALSSVFSSEDRNVSREKEAVSRRKSSSSSSPSTPTGPQSGEKNSPAYNSKDDLSVLSQEAGKKKKNKMKTNPYATTTMWRPITMTSSVSQKEDVVHNFTNFDVLVGGAPRLPATGDLRNEDFLSPVTLSRTVDNPALSGDFEASAVVDAVPPDYHPHPSPDILVRSVSYSDENSQIVKRRLEPTRSAPPAPYVKSPEAVVKRTAARSTSSGVVTIPLKPRSMSIQEQTLTAETLETSPRRSRPSSRPIRDTSPHPSTINGGTDLPADYPRDSSSSASSRRSRSPSSGSRGSRESLERRGRSVMDSSYDVVGLDVGTSIKNVLSKTFGPEEFEQASGHVETMLCCLKRTMESLKTLQTGVSSSGSQFQTVKQELQLQTKQFVQDAKRLVSCANGPRQGVGGQLDTAMQTLARMLLHSQAAMVRMDSVHQAQHVGYELLKVAASFKSTLIAANAALGKPTTDPHMKYLMRQATNLAGLLSTLLKTLKNLEQT